MFNAEEWVKENIAPEITRKLGELAPVEYIDALGEIADWVQEGFIAASEHQD